MQKMYMLKHLPNNSLDGGKKLLESLWWHIELKLEKGQWCVWAGEQILLSTSSKEAAESFVYGLSLAYAMLPPEVLNEYREKFRP
jgi:hypothetical protein